MKSNLTSKTEKKAEIYTNDSAIEYTWLTPPHLHHLDLQLPNPQKFSLEKRISLLLKSLQDNYFSYKRHNCSSFASYRMSLPPIHADSHYIIWEKFIHEIYNFLEEKNRKKLISELLKLESRLNELSQEKKELSPIELLELELTTFEKSSGFSSLHDISANEEKGGVVSLESFKNILSNGHPINDLGVTSQHGRLSHRLQFYLLGKHLLNHVDEIFSVEDKIMLNTFVRSCLVKH